MLRGNARVHLVGGLVTHTTLCNNVSLFSIARMRAITNVNRIHATLGDLQHCKYGPRLALDTTVDATVAVFERLANHKSQIWSVFLTQVGHR